jgi:glycosyltransferase A (GT-A) superfamily protein (DUF2064 family)
LKRLLKKLVTHEVVIGPAEDGGYYLLGLKQKQSSYFPNKTGEQILFLKRQ